MPVKQIAVEDVIVPRGRRTPTDAHVSSIANSLRSLGLLHPITVVSDGNKKYRLVAGRTRLEGAKILQWPKIAANIVAMGDAECQLAEIDENLERSNLTIIEEAVALAKRKELYTLIASQRDANRPPLSAVSSDTVSDEVPNGGESPVGDFLADTSARAGISERTIERRIAAGETLSPRAVTILKDTPAGNSQTQVSALAALPKAEQVEVARIIASGDATTVTGARAALDGKPDVACSVLLAKNAGTINPTHDQLVRLAAMSERHQDAIMRAVTHGDKTLAQAIRDAGAAKAASQAAGQEASHTEDAGPEEIMRQKNAEIESFCRRLMAFVEVETPTDEWIKHNGRGDQARQKIRDACSTLRSCKCSAVCPKCHGEGCTKCLNTGRVTKYVMDRIA